MQDTENKHRDQPFFDNICFIATAHNRAYYGLSYSFAEENIFFTYLIFYCALNLGLLALTWG